MKILGFILLNLFVLRCAFMWAQNRSLWCSHDWQDSDDYGHYVTCTKCGKTDYKFYP